MQLEAIYHRPGNSYCYPYDDRTIHIRLRAKKNDLQKVKALYGDKYDWDNTVREAELHKLGSDDLFDYWQTEVVPPHLRLRYAFELVAGEQTVWYTEKGFVKEKPADPLSCFDYPFLWTSEVLQPPAWVKDAVFYQIFPDRFANGDPANDPDQVRPWEESNPGPHDFYGGDLQGVLERLDYISSLGVNAIYFTPLFEAKTNHKYDTTDYLKVDPQFGDTELLKKLVKACHDRGIRVILDAVFNHCGYWFAPFQDVLKNGEASRYRDWFHIKQFPLVRAPRPSYHCFAFESHMPKLNTVNPEVRAYLLDVAQYWIRECDIDGWRLDVANEIDHEFWREFRKACKDIKPDFYILGEIWHDAMPWLQGDQFDAVMNYPVTEAIIDFFAKGELDAEQFSYQVNKLLADYPQQVNEATFTILGSHDTPRLLTVAQDERKAMLAVLFQFIFLGAPCIYYGDEAGMTGGPDPDCRKPMVWEEEQQNRALFDFYRELISLRTAHRALQAGSFQIIYANRQQLAVLRKHASEQLYICFNNSGQEASFSFAGMQRQPVTATMLGKGTYTLEKDEITVCLPAFGWMVFMA
ncbi:alpha-glycosidase [Paenibacillus apiarius]|uniref:Alpha-glycosidase n=1 Tax=Paenibacillus apiarius TaxID=46240 RepID=A0ABT4DRF7_9BACL|nr:alpha-glycosidase [Paenibacillus apiarius]MCY9516645.1 alpha-glycosidase [Paenibacillus apiarius]MCY9519957.1 alpha-glycosidase [Paenibacillus apiarius]MCY9553805.1 alpha-glycosidase [Paenibacillus apiarius]MCY9557587.1 alpha-glycosidase [Paenibacillus apiarius]MCY9685547.1 alpha-glycosidase [Paenibacillus apiarius]